ncbi:hypothetical protein [Endozoicomonas sp. 2B-B]
MEVEDTIHAFLIKSAKLSADGRHLAIYSTFHDAVKIYGQQANGSWLQKTAVRNRIRFTKASFSADSRHVMAICHEYPLRISELRKKD